MLTDRLYTGQQLDATSGLYLMGARFYDPSVGRWIQPDNTVPIATNPQQLNRYTFGNNNPLRFSDPTGTDGWDVINRVRDFVQGVGNSIGDSLSLNQMTPRLERAGMEVPSSLEYALGRSLGDVLAMIGGASLGTTGGETALAGLATGPGAVVAVPGGLLVMGAGTVIFVTGAANLHNDISQVLSKRSGNKGRTGPKLPLVRGPLKGPNGLDIPADVANKWAPGTFGGKYGSFENDLAATIEYHFGEHGAGRTVEEYTQDAVMFWNEYKDEGVLRVWNRAWGESYKLETDNRIGYYPREGRILTYLEK